MKTVLGMCACLGVAAGAHGAPRDIQFRSINLNAGVVELHNFGDTAEDLTGWRFCTHNGSVVRRYSAPAGLDGVVIQPGDSLYVYMNGGASASDEINAATIGGAFAAFDVDAYGLQVYFPPVVFADGNQIADAVQWTADGSPDATADERSDEAVTGGVWGSVVSFVPVDGGEFLRLMDLTGAELHGAESYASLAEIVDCNMNGRDDALEIIDGTYNPCETTGTPCVADLDGDGSVGSGDLGILLAAWGPCP